MILKSVMPLLMALAPAFAATGAAAPGTDKSAVTTSATKPTDTTAKAGKPAKANAKSSLAPGLYATFYTAKGQIVVALEFEKTPLTVCNFVGLAEGTKKSNKPAGKPFYDGLTFHRVISDFMIQGGDPAGNGTGGPDYNFADEFDPTLKHDRPGILSMANSGPGTNGSQFFITHVPTPHLDGKHSIFGHVVTGQDVVNKVAMGDKLDSLRITRVGAKATAFKATEEKFQELSKNVGKAKEGKMKEQTAEYDALLKKAKSTPSGLKYIVTQKGSGPKPVKGKNVKAHYTGKLTNGTKFDSSLDRGQPIEFPVGVGMVIPGWDEALMDMEKGEKRTLIIPPNLGYGERGSPPVIPPNSILIFDVELVDVTL